MNTPTPSQFNQATSALQQELTQATASARRANRITLFVSAFALAGLGYWLYDANQQIVSFDAKTAVQYASAELQGNLPAAGEAVQDQLIAAAPHIMSELERELMDAPDKFAKELLSVSSAEMDKLTPQLEQELYKSIKAALVAAKDNLPPGSSDEQRISALLEVLADVYAKESIKLIDELKTKYQSSSQDLYTYLDFLAEGQGLDTRQTLHRQMVQTLLSLAVQQKSEPHVDITH
jgi:hypothetical protein